MTTFTHGHALIIGIGSYQHEPRLNVPITAADAGAVTNVLRDPQACGYPPDQVTLLHDSSATRNGILAALDALAQRTKPDDTVFLFYSGHGDLDGAGTYHLTTHDTRLEGTAVVGGTGISQAELLDKLRAIKAGRLLLFLNACFSGNVAPTLSTDKQPPTLGTMLPEQTAAAILGTGAGRAIVTAARESQYSFIGTGTLTIFAQTLVDGLRGMDMSNRDGTITLFDLYAHLYDTVGQKTAPLVNMLPKPMREKHQGDRQQPELTLLKNLGVMTVALHPGTTAPTSLSADGQLRDDLPRREVDEQTSQHALQQLISGAGAVGIGGDANAPITTGSENVITTTGDISGNSGLVAVGSNIAQSSGGGSASITINEADKAHDVRGIPNPYLGLEPFTYAERNKYAGRDEQIRVALTKLTTPGEQRVLLFITGASGSGKSSFAQAGLIPALEQHYQQRHHTVRHAVFRPSKQPMAMLADALLQLGMPAVKLDAPPATIYEHIQAHTPDQTISVIVIDQFEELFTQSESVQRDTFFTLLTTLPSFGDLRVHVIATVRADYLPELFAHQALYDEAKRGIDLRVMTEDALRQAIQQPLIQHPDAQDKRFEDALLNRLASDAADAAAYLPLLQVTLARIWSGGLLKLSAYGTLTDAIQQQAEEVYTFRPDGTPRPEAEQQAILAMLLDLVDVSPTDDDRRDVRRRRDLEAILQNAPERWGLVTELATARLLSTGRETRAGAEVVDIIHESLLSNWARLKQAIDAERETLQQRARFELALHEWQANEQQDAYLLTGVRLSEAEALDAQGDVALRSPIAQELLKRSVTQREAEQQAELKRQRQLAEKERQRAEEQQRRAHAERQRAHAEQQRAEEQRRRAQVEQAARERAEKDQKRLQWSLFYVFTALMLALGAAWFAFDRQQVAVVETERAEQEADARATAEANAEERANEAEQEADARATAQAEAEQEKAAAQSQLLISDAQTALLGQNPDQALALSLAATLDDRFNQREEIVLSQAAYAPGTIRRFVGHSSGVTTVATRPDGQHILSGSWDNTLRLWDVDTGEAIQQFDYPTGGILSVKISPDGQTILIGTTDGIMQLWDISTGETINQFVGHSGWVYSVAFSPDGNTVASGSDDKTIALWDISTGQQIGESLSGHTDAVRSVVFSPDGHMILSGSGDGTIRLWDITSGSEIQPINAHSSVVSRVDFSPDGQYFVSSSWGTTLKLWETESGTLVDTFVGHASVVTSVIFSPNGRYILSASEDNTLRLWDRDRAIELHRFYGHRNKVEDVVFHPDGHVAFSASDDKYNWSQKLDHMRSKDLLRSQRSMWRGE